MTPRHAIVVLFAAVVVAACGGGEPVERVEPTPVSTTATTAPAVEEAATVTTDPAPDPFEVYLSLAPADAPELTPDDALTRAVLGCGTEWPPGTTDHALAVAYAEVLADMSGGEC